MAFQDDKKTMIGYMNMTRQELFGLGNEQELEKFFMFIDELEQKAEEEPQYFSLLADAYMQLGNNVKAKEAFAKVYNPKNKKDLRKLMSYDGIKSRPVIRPSKRAKEIPQFKYVDKQMLSNQFIVSEECACSICKKKPAALYVGAAYTDSDEEISFLNRADKFCADCIHNGAAAAELDIKFNLPLLEEHTAIDIEKRNELLYRTPECSTAFDFDEDIWPSCCGDYCRYVGLDDEYEENFHFQCIQCGKKLVWTRMD